MQALAAFSIDEQSIILSFLPYLQQENCIAKCQALKKIFAVNVDELQKAMGSADAQTLRQEIEEKLDGWFHLIGRRHHSNDPLLDLLVMALLVDHESTCTDYFLRVEDLKDYIRDPSKISSAIVNLIGAFKRIERLHVDSGDGALLI